MGRFLCSKAVQGLVFGRFGRCCKLKRLVFLQKQEPFLCIRCDLPGASTKKLETQHFDASSLFCHSRLFAIFNRSFSGFDCICFSERSLGYGRIGERFFGISRISAKCQRTKRVKFRSAEGSSFDSPEQKTRSSQSDRRGITSLAEPVEGYRHLHKNHKHNPQKTLCLWASYGEEMRSAPCVEKYVCWN
jgi:hypothetical protein